MSLSANGTVVADTPAWAPETPFEETLAFETVAAEPGAFSGFLETPFVSEYRLGETVVDHTADELRELLSELYDREFDEAVTQLVAEADAQLFQLEADGPADPAFRQQLLEEWVGPLRREADAMLTSMAEALEAADTASLGEAQLDEILDRFEPRTGEQTNPAFQGLLGNLWKKAKKIAKGALKLAKQGISVVGKILPIGALLRKLKQLVWPLLKKVLKLALDKLPAGLRPAAARLAKKLLGEAPEPAGESYPAAGPDAGELQRELDLQLLGLVTAADEVEGEVVVTEAAAEADEAEDHSLAELQVARARFVDEINGLQPGQDPTAAVENLVPVVMGALKLGVSLIGRPKIVKFLSKLLGRLIKPMVGKELTPALSKAIVDLGLKSMALEAPSPDEANLGAEAVAATIEGTVARLAAVNEATLANDTLFELAIHRAFGEAAAANFPPDLVKAELRETHGVRGTWVSRPRGGAARYKKFSHVFRDVEITPQMAAQLVTFGGVGLDQYLTEVLGVTAPVRANIRLYEAIRGTTLPRIAALERNVPGLGTSASPGWSQFHPLITSTAGVLLGEPALGNDVPARFLQNRRVIGVGQRFYHLDVPGARVQTYRNPRTGRVEARLPSNWDFSLARRGFFAVYFFLSEREAQESAARLRQGEFVNQVLAHIAALHDRLAARKFPGPDGQLWVGGTDGSLRPLDPRLKEPLFWSVKTWVLGTLAEKFMDHAVRNQFLACADDPADGVFLLLLFRHPVADLVLSGPNVPTADALTALQTRATPTASALSIGAGAASLPPMPPI